MWQLGLVQPEWFGAQGPGVESPTFPCSMQVLTPCPVLPLVLGKEPLNESTGGATSKPQDPGARLRTPGDLLQGGMVPRSSGMWSGARQPSRLHCLPLPAWEQCLSWPGHGLAMVLLPRAVPSPPLSPSLFPFPPAEAAPDPGDSPAAKPPLAESLWQRRQDLRPGCAWWEVTRLEEQER